MLVGGAQSIWQTHSGCRTDAGALNLLRNVETIDWTALYSGEICMDEVHRVRRVARRDIISLPTFVANVDNYRKQLRQIAAVNGIEPRRATPPAVAKSPGPTPNHPNVEPALPAVPPRHRQRTTAKLTATPATRHSTRRANKAKPAAVPVVIAEKAGTDIHNHNVEQIRYSKEKLRLAGCEAEMASCQLTSMAAKRLARLKRQYERHAGCAVNISPASKRLDVLMHR